MEMHLGKLPAFRYADTVVYFSVLLLANGKKKQMLCRNFALFPRLLFCLPNNQSAFS